MQDIIAKGETWFEAQRREHLAVTVNYQPTVGLARDCKATLITGKWESVDSAGNIVRMETRDFFIHRDELTQDPQRGDLVVVTENGLQKTYKVTIVDGTKQAWRWSDRSERIRRIHTMGVGQSVVVPHVSPFLVRGVGVSADATLDDEGIKETLTLDLGTGRALSRLMTVASQYVYVVLPDSFGVPTFKVNGVTSTALALVTRSIEFDGQASRAYRVYRSAYVMTGIVDIEVL